MKHITELWQLNSYTNDEVIRLGITLSGDALQEFLQRGIEQSEKEEIDKLNEQISDLEDALIAKDEKIDDLESELALSRP